MFNAFKWIIIVGVVAWWFVFQLPVLLTAGGILPLVGIAGSALIAVPTVNAVVRHFKGKSTKEKPQ